MIIACDKNVIVHRPQDVARILQRWLATVDVVDRDKEHLIAVHINVRNKITRIEIVGIGIVDAALVHPREVYKRAVRQSASQIIVAHNHPSGDCTPSDEDRLITERLIQAGDVLGIALLDHIIFSRKAFHSMKENGVI